MSKTGWKGLEYLALIIKLATWLGSWDLISVAGICFHQRVCVSMLVKYRVARLRLLHATKQEFSEVKKCRGCLEL